MINNERGNDKKLSNFTIYLRRSILLITNGFENKGVLINKNREEVANFFQFDDKDYHIYKSI